MGPNRKARRPLPVARHAERPLWMHGAVSPGAPKGERNGAYRHGLYTAEAIKRRELSAWIKVTRTSAADLFE